MTIAPVDDGDPEPTQVVTVSGSASIAGVTGPDDVTLTILDDDPVASRASAPHAARPRPHPGAAEVRHSFKGGSAT